MHLDDPKYTTEQHKVIIERLKGLSADYGEPISPSENACKKKFEALEETLTEGECWWLVDLKLQEVTWSCGVKEALGYIHKINLFDTISWIHGKYRNLLMEYNLHMENIVRELLHGKIEHMKQRYVVEIPIRHQKGHYLNGIRTSYPFQFDANQNMVSHMHHFYIHPNQNNHIFDISIFDSNTLRRDDLLKEIRKRVLEISSLPFSKRQLDILAYYANGKVQKAEDVAILGKIEVSTVYTHQKNIIRLAKNDTGIKFPEIKDVAEYYRSRRLI